MVPFKHYMTLAAICHLQPTKVVCCCCNTPVFCTIQAQNFPPNHRCSNAGLHDRAPCRFAMDSLSCRCSLRTSRPALNSPGLFPVHQLSAWMLMPAMNTLMRLPSASAAKSDPADGLSSTGQRTMSSTGHQVPLHVTQQARLQMAGPTAWLSGMPRRPMVFQRARQHSRADGRMQTFQLYTRAWV